MNPDNLKKGRMIVVGYRDKFLSLARYAPDEIDTEAKKKEILEWSA